MLQNNKNSWTCLDLFCGAGGAAKGLHDAGFDIIGVDINPQPNFPFTFVQGDATNPPFDLAGFDFIWASPVCKAFTVARHIQGNEHPNQIPATRELLRRSGVPYCIENVPGAPLEDPFMLCGTMFGLNVIRHRHFEASFPVLAPTCGRHGRTMSKDGYSTKARGAEFITVAGNNYPRTEGAAAMGGLDWMTRPELSQAIPPAYSEWIARQFLRQMMETAQ